MESCCSPSSSNKREQTGFQGRCSTATPGPLPVPPWPSTRKGPDGHLESFSPMSQAGWGRVELTSPQAHKPTISQAVTPLWSAPRSTSFCTAPFPLCASQGDIRTHELILGLSLGSALGDPAQQRGFILQETSFRYPENSSLSLKAAGEPACANGGRGCLGEKPRRGPSASAPPAC